MKKMYVMVALPRAGKSTYINNHFQGVIRVSADQLRLLIHGKRFWDQGEAKVWWVRDIMIKALMEQGLDIVIDQTNTTRPRRKYLLELAARYGYQALAIVITTDKELCKERAVSTNQEDLIPVIEKMAENYEKVNKEEGFYEIIHVE